MVTGIVAAYLTHPELQMGIVIWTEHTSTVYLGGPEGPPPWLEACLAEIFEFRVLRLA